MRHFNGIWLIYLGLGLIALGVHGLAAHYAHIVVSIVALVIFTVAALQAGAITLQNFFLKQRPGDTYTIQRMLPPVDALRDLLFKTLWAGFVFLSVSMLGAFIFLPNVLNNITPGKLILSTLAWALFAAMLYGYQRHGWRNDLVSICALLGLILLGAAYVVSKIFG